MRETLRDAVYATLAYSSIFDYPLTEAEIARWLIGFSGSGKHFSGNLQTILSQLLKEGRYYSLVRSQSKILARKRRIRENIALQKWQIANAVIKLLRYIPSLMFIGVSGGLSMNNVESEDDIDLFIITAPRTVWISRLLVLLLLECLGRRRTFNSKKEKDLICANMFISEECLSLSHLRRDLYTAHEILQVVPLFERDRMHHRFLLANRWVQTFLPNAWRWRINQENEVRSRKYESGIHTFILHTSIFILQIVEPLAKWIQKLIMTKHITTEVVTDTALQFHPHDARHVIKKRFLKALKFHNIPIDSDFFPELQ